MNKLHLIWIIGGVALGIIAGFSYWYFIGCNTGECPITSIWYNTSAYGGLMGGLLGSMVFSIAEGKNDDNSDQSEKIDSK